jgi:predicted short-subunit dehydrogenase-like oxidoreductase (DUF2520 family)
MKIAILGSGNVATHLGKALIKAGYPVMEVWSRHLNHAKELALALGVSSIATIANINSDVDLVVVAVADDAIVDICAQIPKKANRLIVHTSGSTDMAILKSFSDEYGVIYPLQTFSKSAEINFKHVPLFLEANSTSSIEKLKSIAHQLSDHVQMADSKKRAFLHISAVFACNFTNYFYTIAQQILAQNHLDFDLLRPLIQETATKAMLNLPADVQTGPARRNDKSIMNKHLEMLNDYPNWQNLYHLISQDIVKMYSFQQAKDK